MESSVGGTDKWILLRGLGRESAHWGPFQTQIEEAFPEATIHSLDFPGFGQARLEKAAWTTRGIVDFLHKQVKSEGQLGILGHSFGGMVALEWAARYPHQVGRLVLLNTSVQGVARWHQRLKVPAVKQLAEIFTQASDRDREEKILKLVSRVPERHAETLQTWIRIAKERSPDRLAILRQLWLAGNAKLPSFSQAKPHILCLAGLGDTMVDPQCTKELARAVGAPAAFHPWAGHELTLDDPEWVLEQIRKWLAGHPV
jgi:pimeloyl-ACP methyl ester carboxylesterase